MYSVVPCGCVSDRVKDIFLSQVSLLTVESEFNFELLIDLSSIWKVEDLTGTLLDATKGCLLVKPVTERVLLLMILKLKLNIEFNIELS